MRIRADTHFAIIPEWLLDAGVSSRAVVVYARLSRFADKDGQAWPSRSTLAGLCNCSADSVDRALQELVAAQALTIRRRHAQDGGWTSSTYLIRRTPPSRNRAATPSRTSAQ